MVKVYWNYEDMFCHVHADDSKKKSVYKCFESSTGCDQFCQELMNMYPRLKNAIGDLSEAKQERRIAMSMIERDGAICHNSTNKLSELSPNSIDDTFARLLDLEITRDLADL